MQATATRFDKLTVTRRRALGDDTMPLSQAREGETITATVDIYVVKRTGDGRATSSATNDGGAAVLRFSKDVLSRHGDILHDCARIQVRGTVANVLGNNVIDVYAARTA